MEQVTGRLEGWWYDHLNHIFWGFIYDDVRNRWWDGAYIHTSHCHNPEAKEGDVIQTRNSRYLLGKPASKENVHAT